MSADYVDGQPHMDAKAKGFARMRKFFGSDSNDLGATFKEIVLDVGDWNVAVFVVADRDTLLKYEDKPTEAAVLDVM
jgi:hypothetical protein